MTDQPLAVATRAKHKQCTCGQSRNGGVGTSDSRRRSNVFGRVAVTHVQGSPKGGGALGLLRVPNTRLAPVPLCRMGVLMQRSGTFANNHKDSSQALRS